MFKYDLHVHTNASSCCGVSTPEEQVAAYAGKGYNGIVITDHFVCGCNATPFSRELPWKERIDLYYRAYERAAEAAAKYTDFNVFFGAEYSYAGGHDLLIYGLDKELLYAHPEIEEMSAEDFCGVFSSNGCLVVQAHPFRDRFYNDNTVPPELPCADGVEVFNACNSEEENAGALSYAEKSGKIFTSGGDIHSAEDERIGLAGIATDSPITDIKMLTDVLKSGNYSLIVGGKVKTLSK